MKAYLLNDFDKPLPKLKRKTRDWSFVIRSIYINMEAGKFIKLLIAVWIFLPQITFAAGYEVFLNRISEKILQPIIFLLFALAFLVFLWGGFQFVAHLDSEDDRRTGGRHMLWGIIGAAIMLSALGIIALIQGTIDFF